MNDRIDQHVATKLIATERNLRESFLPLVMAMAQHKADLEYRCVGQKIGALDGMMIELRPNKADAPRIYGKGGKTWQALSEIATSIGFFNRIPVRLGFMQEPTKNTESGRYWLDRDGSIPLIFDLVKNVAVQLFDGDQPVVEMAGTEENNLVIKIQISPGSKRLIHRKWEAMETVFKSICQPYGWLPSISLDQCLTAPERQPDSNYGRFSR